MRSEFAVKIENLTKFYGEKIKALNRVNLNIQKGTSFGLLGPNGAGKTTLIRILNCIIQPTHGTAYVGGYNIQSDTSKVKEICGLLSENPRFYKKLTIHEFLVFVGKLYSLEKELIEKNAKRLVKLFKLEERYDDTIETLSQGMKQKLGLCTALIHDPEILFLDEPTANLDPMAARTVKDLLLGYVNKTNKTIVLSTHLLDVAKELCDVLAILDKGEIKIQGTHQEIISNLHCNNLEEAFIKLCQENPSSFSY